MEQTTSDPEQRRIPPEHHHGHRNVTGGWLRPAVFGVMDGLVTNLCLISGIAGSGAAHHSIVVAGVAGVIAGSFSMSAGEYTSVQSQAEATLAEVEIERVELSRSPKAEEAELAGMYRERGLDPELAREVARQLSLDPETALRVHTQEELGVDVDALPSPWIAAFSSMASFAVGSFVPLLPFLLGARTLLVAWIVGAVVLFAVGAFVSRFTTRSAWYSGLRLLLIGAASATITFGVGKLVG